jgi:hypothetical protein
VRDRTLVADLAVAGVCALALVFVTTRLLAPFASGSAGIDRGPSMGQLERRLNDARQRFDRSLIWEALQPGDPIYEGDTVFVGALSQASITLHDGSHLEIDENSLVVMHQRAAEGVTTVELVRGAAAGRSVSGALALRVGGNLVGLGENAAVKVRATGQSLKIDVASGAARLTAEGHSTDLSAGQRGLVNGAGPPSIEELAISLTGPSADLRTFFSEVAPEVVFTWQSREGADSRYIFELSRDFEFKTLVRSERCTVPRLALSGLDEGIFYWRVRSPTGASDERKLILVRDRPPIAFRPAEAEVVDVSHGESLGFGWSEVENVNRYLIEVALDGNFDSPIATGRPRHGAWLLDRALDEGRYCFRARSAEAERGTSPWSRTACFRLINNPILKAPKLFAPRREELPAPEPDKGSWLFSWVLGEAYAADPKSSAIVLRWETISGASSYLLEIAEDRGFKRPVLKQSVNVNYFRWAIVARRDYFWRVRAVDAAGREGETSEPVRIGSEVAPPTLGAPEAGRRIAWANEAPRIVLSWQPSPIIARYTLEVADDARFTSEVVNQSLTGTELVFEPRRVGDFYWRVVGTDLEGRTTESSQTRKFVVFPAIPEPGQPRAAETIVFEGGTRQRFTWSARPVDTYELEIAADSQFRKRLAQVAGAQSSANVELKVPGVMHWRVRGKSPETAWSASQSFTLVPASPQLLEPAEGWAGEPETSAFELRWAAVPQATSYELELRKDSERGTALPLTQTRHALEGLEPGLYHWLVRAKYGSIASAPSAERSFELKPKEALAEATAVAPVVKDEVPPVLVQPAPAAPEPPRALYLAPRLGGVSNFGAVTTVVFSLELGYRFPSLERRLGVSLAGGYYTAAQSAADSGARVTAQSRLHAVPIELRVQYIQPTQAVDLTAAAGPSLYVLHALVSVPGQPSFSATAVSFGATLAVGAERHLGPGTLFAEVSYSLATRHTGLVETDPGGLGFALGYRIPIW